MPPKRKVKEAGLDEALLEAADKHQELSGGSDSEGTEQLGKGKVMEGNDGKPTTVEDINASKVLKRRLRQARYRERRKVREASDAEKIKSMEARIQALTSALSAAGALHTVIEPAALPAKAADGSAQPAGSPAATSAGATNGAAAAVQAVAGANGSLTPGQGQPLTPAAIGALGAGAGGMVGSVFPPMAGMSLVGMAGQTGMHMHPALMMPHHSIITPHLLAGMAPVAGVTPIVSSDSALASGWYRIRVDSYPLLEMANKLLRHACDAPSGGVPKLEEDRVAAGIASAPSEQAKESNGAGTSSLDSSRLPPFVAAAGWQSAMYECTRLAIRGGKVTETVAAALRGQMVDDLSVCHRALSFIRARIDLAERTAPSNGKELLVSTSDCHALTQLLGTFSHMFVFFAAGMHAAGYVTSEDTEFFSKFEELQAWDNNVMAAFEILTGAAPPSLGGGASNNLGGSLHPRMQIIYLMHSRAHQNLAWWLMTHRPGALTAIVTLFAVHLPLITRMSVYKANMAPEATADVATLRASLHSSTITLLNEAVNVSAGRLNLQKLMDEKVFKLNGAEKTTPVAESTKP